MVVVFGPSARARGVAGPHDPFSGRLAGVAVAVVWEMTN